MFTLLVLLIILIVLLCVLAFLALINWYVERLNPYHESNLRHWKGCLIKQQFAGRTVGGFKVPYDLHLFCTLQNREEFIDADMLDEAAQQNLAATYHDEVFMRYFEDSSYLFYFDWWGEENDSRPHNYATSPIAELVRESGKTFLKPIPAGKIRADLEKLPFQKNGCDVKAYFHNSPFNDEMIEENYAMLTDEQKKEVEADPRYDLLVEMIAVAALKRRLEFLGTSTKQKHQAEKFSIETENVGRGVAVRWSLNSNTSYELVGFRNSGGFHSDEWDESYNGTMIVHSERNGETVELLKEGEAAFYTFFLRSKYKLENGSRHKCSLLRFQFVVPSKAETEAIEAVLERAEQRKLADPRGNMSQALKELGLAMEFQDSLDEMEKSLIEQIRKKNLPKDEEEEKIEFVRDAARLQRDKYQP
jgi:hypothetical protein